jgi:hypothetical protein
VHDVCCDNAAAGADRVSAANDRSNTSSNVSETGRKNGVDYSKGCMRSKLSLSTLIILGTVKSNCGEVIDIISSTFEDGQYCSYNFYSVVFMKDAGYHPEAIKSAPPTPSRSCPRLPPSTSPASPTTPPQLRSWMALSLSPSVSAQSYSSGSGQRGISIDSMHGCDSKPAYCEQLVEQQSDQPQPKHNIERRCKEPATHAAPLNGKRQQ